jgi:UDP-glucuronate 4-epimerase
MAFTYSHLYNFRTIGLRFFTVYGPWGRPDMAPFIFAEKIMNNEQITVYNNGNSTRDFTYIDDVTLSINLILNSKFSDSEPLASIYNIGNSNPVTVLNFINILEKALNKKAIVKFEKLQPGDVINTFADVNFLYERFGAIPSMALEDGLEKFATWFKNYYF